VNGWVVVFWNKWKRVIYRYICERRLCHVGITPIYGGDTNYLRFLFSWDCVPGQDKNRLLDFLTETLDSSWVKNAKIVKSEDDITRYVFAGEKSVEITLDENMEKAVLKANDGRIYNLQLKQETGRINIYRPVEN
jgi:hypothetical protein